MDDGLVSHRPSLWTLEYAASAEPTLTTLHRLQDCFGKAPTCTSLGKDLHANRFSLLPRRQETLEREKALPRSVHVVGSYVRISMLAISHAAGKLDLMQAVRFGGIRVICHVLRLCCQPKHRDLQSAQRWCPKSYFSEDP